MRCLFYKSLLPSAPQTRSMEAVLCLTSVGKSLDSELNQLYEITFLKKYRLKPNAVPNTGVSYLALCTETRVKVT